MLSSGGRKRPSWARRQLWLAMADLVRRWRHSPLAYLRSSCRCSRDQSVHAHRVADVNAGIQVPGGLAAVTRLPGALQRVLMIPRSPRGAHMAAMKCEALPDVPSACRFSSNSLASRCPLIGDSPPVPPAGRLGAGACDASCRGDVGQPQPAFLELAERDGLAGRVLDAGWNR